MKNFLSFLLMLAGVGFVHAQDTSQRVIPTAADPPTACVAGKLYPNSTTKKVYLGTNLGGCQQIDASAAAAVWGAIAGTLSSQTDLQSALNAKEATANKDAASGYAGLDSGTKLKASEIPSTVVQTNQANTFGAFLQKILAGSDFQLADPSDTSKIVQFDLSNIATSNTRTVTVPNANSSTVQTITCTNQFLRSISGQGLPACSSIAGADLPNPSASTLGGTQSAAAVSHQFIDSISPSGVPHLSQPASTDVSGLGTAATQNTGTSGANIPFLNGANTWSATQNAGVFNATTNFQFNSVAISVVFPAKVTTQFDKTTDTVLANVPGLSVTLTAGRTYNVRVVLHVSPDATGGAKVALGGTATATTYRQEIIFIRGDNNTIGISSGSPSLGTSLGTAGGGYYEVTIDATILVNAGGTITAQFAENASSGTSSVLWGSYMLVHDLN
jgi:hypothetical protein